MSNSIEPTTWQNSIPTLTPTEKYLWAQFTKTEGFSSSVWTGVVGIYGDTGPVGDDYVLTDADKAEIAEMAADLVEVPELSDGKVDFVVQDTPPEDTSVLWVDPTDNSADEIPDSGGNVDQEPVIETGVMVSIEADESEKITVDSNTTEEVTLVHSSKNLIGFLPSMHNKTMSGVHIVINDDGSVTLNGTATANVYVDWALRETPNYFPPGIYALSSNIETSGVHVQFLIDGTAIATCNNIINRKSFELTDSTEAWGVLQINAGVVCDNLTVWMQLERGTSLDYDNHPEQFTEYAPYVRTETKTKFPVAVNGYDGANIFFTKSGNALSVITDTDGSVDVTLTQQGKPADAKITGDKFRVLFERAENENALTIEGYTDTKRGFVNVRGDAKKTEGAFWSASGSPATSATWSYFELSVSEGERFRISTFTVSAGRAFYVYDGEGRQLMVYPPEPASPGARIDETVTMPVGAVTLICNEERSSGALILEKFTEEIGTRNFVRDDSYVDSRNVLSGKKLVFCGDSITAAVNPDGGYFESYGEIVAKRNGMISVKDGIGGSTMTNVDGKNPFCVSRYLNHTDFDYITLWFGWNDNAYATLGTIDDTDDTTFYGAYKKVLEHYIINYPTKKIGIIVPYGDLEAHQQAVRELSERYGVPCLDLADGKRCSLVWGRSNDAQVARRNALTYDTTHPNQAGYEFIATMYEHFLRSL